jgi:peptidoglycan/LPS O-acetylase OafA/YrhL
MKKLAFLDGIRGWGAFVVLVYHVFVDGLPISKESKNILSPLFFFNGTLAVWIFFIVSGFSLSIAYSVTKEKGILLKIAYGRYLRLAIPILFFSLLMFFAFKVGLILPVEERPEIFRGTMVQAPSLENTILFSFYNVFFNYSFSTTLIPPLWTMSIEIFGSCLVLMLCAICGGSKLNLLFYAIATVVAIIFSPYYAAFFIGIIFAELYAQRKLKDSNWVALASLTTGAFLAIFLPTAGSHMYLLISVLFFYGIIGSPIMKNIMENKLSRFMGKISFTLYLLHAIIMWTFSLLGVNFLIKNGADNHANLFLINLFTILISILLSRCLVYIDELSVLISRRFSRVAISCTNFLLSC